MTKIIGFARTTPGKKRGMEALKAAVERSNREKGIDIQSAMKNASEAILSDLKGVVDSYKAEVEQATERLHAATKKKDDNEKKEIAIFLAGVFGVVFAAFYLSLYNQVG